MTSRVDGGFTLVELIAIIVVLGVISVTVASRSTGTLTAQLQASRDSIVAALLLAQQRAMAQVDPVRVVSGGSQLDIQQDSGGGYQSVRIGGMQYPLDLAASQTLSSHTLEYNRLGQIEGVTTNTSMVLSQGSGSITITISPSGFSQ